MMENKKLLTMKVFSKQHAQLNGISKRIGWLWKKEQDQDHIERVMIEKCNWYLDYKKNSELHSKYWVI